MKKKKAKSGRESSSISTQSHHHHQGHHRSSPSCKKVVIKQYEEIPNRYRSSIDPLNLEEQKLQFLKHGQIPHFQFKVTPEKIEELSHSKRAEIEFDLVDEAVHILEKVRQKYGSGNLCVEQMYGERIDTNRASRKLSRYLQQNGADGHVTIGWTKDQACSAKMAWCGPSMRANRPEARKFSLWLKDSTENQFLRERGILCLADHEIGTHFLRTLNDGLQPWFSSRENFGLRRIRSHRLQETEEGLATINSLVQANHKYLWIPALIYYTACKAATMSFEELFNHLGHFLENREQRWRYVMRVKRSLPDPSGIGGYGNDQCYFKGAVEILRNMENIDFHLMYSGKVCLESLPRIQRTARLDCIRLPHFLRDMEAYLKTLRTIASVNGLKSKSSSLPKALGHSGKQKKARVRRTSSKKRRKGTGKAKGLEDSVAETTVTVDDEEEGTEEDLVPDDQNDSDVEDAIFQRTFNEFACLPSSMSREVEVEDNRGATGAEAGKNNILRSPYGRTFPNSPTASSTDRPASPHNFHHLENSPKVRCQSQPNIANMVDDVHVVAKALTPSPHKCTEIQSPLSLSRLSPTHTATTPVSLPSSPPSRGSSLQCSGFKWGAAERMGTSIPSSMPLVSTRFNREKSDSPVPFSPHRWLLWRRDKCPPNSLNS